MKLGSIKISAAFRKTVLRALNSTNISLAINKLVFDRYGVDVINSVIYGAKKSIQYDFTKDDYKILLN